MSLFTERFLPLIEKSGKTDTELEKAMELPRSIIYDWRTGRNKSSYKKYASNFATYFNVSTDYLLGNKTDGSGENNVVLAKDEQELLNDYRLLNDLGKSEAQKRVNELTNLNQYTTQDSGEGEDDSDLFIPVAARKARTNNRKLKKRNSNIKLSDLPDYKG